MEITPLRDGIRREPYMHYSLIHASRLTCIVENKDMWERRSWNTEMRDLLTLPRKDCEKLKTFVESNSKITHKSMRPLEGSEPRWSRHK